MERTSDGTTTGNLGQSGRIRITPTGELVDIDGTPRLGWFIAADDRWHVPAVETAVRQRRIDGTPVTETRVRVPNGDIVQRIYSVADAGGITVVEVENESTLPVAIAFDRRDVMTERPIGATPIEGIDLGPDAFVLPLGHKASLRVGVRHAGGEGRLPAIPAASDVVRGWIDTAQRAGSFGLPPSAVGMVDRVVAARCDLALDGVVGDDPTAFLIGLDQIVRIGIASDPKTLSAWVPDVAHAVAMLGRDNGWRRDAALAAADRVLWCADEDRARRDLARMIDGAEATFPPVAESDDDLGGTDLLAWVERRLARGGALLPDGLPNDWRGQSFECGQLPTAAGSTVSFAVRWHGERPAVLWEQHGPAVTLTAPAIDRGWSSAAAHGEALWGAASPADAT